MVVLNSKPVGEFLERVGWGRFQTYIFWIAGLAWLSDLLWLINMSVIMQDAGDHWGLNQFERSFFSISFNLGLYVGSYLYGFLGDKLGRVRVFKKTVLVAFLGGVLVTASVDIYMLNVMCFLTGIGVGGEISLGGTVFCEFIPPSKTYLLALLCMFWCIGGLMSACLALVFTLVGSGPFMMWRWVCGVCCIFELVFWYLRLSLPETPHYLYTQNKNSEMDEVLKRICKSNNSDFTCDIEKTKMLLQDFDQESSEETNEETKDPKCSLLKKVFSSEYAKQSTIFTLVYFGICFSMGGLLIYMPELISESGPNISGWMIYVSICCQQLCGTIGVGFASYLIESRLGRKWTLCLTIISSSLFCFLFMIGKNFAMVVIFSSMTYTCSYMGWAALYTITPESYPTEIRNSAVGWTNAWAKAGGFVSPLFMGLILDLPGGYFIVLATSAVGFCCVAIASSMLRETKGNSAI